jgi:8-oxo-dGTP diphosphatase
MPGRFLVGVSVFVVHDGAVLLLRRTNARLHAADTWEPVGGRVEQGETPVEAAAREVIEDTGLEIDRLEPFHTFTLERGPGHEKLIGICFAGSVSTRDVKLSPEHSKVRWTPIGKLADAELPRGVLSSVTAFHARWGPTGSEFGAEGA